MLKEHLIRELLKIEGNPEIWTEGCDCHGDTFCVEKQENGTVLIRRSDYLLYQENKKKKPIDRISYDNKNDTPTPL